MTQNVYHYISISISPTVRPQGSSQVLQPTRADVSRADLSFFRSRSHGLRGAEERPLFESVLGAALCKYIPFHIRFISVKVRSPDAFALFIPWN